MGSFYFFFFFASSSPSVVVKGTEEEPEEECARLCRISKSIANWIVGVGIAGFLFAWVSLRHTFIH